MSKKTIIIVCICLCILGGLIVQVQEEKDEYRSVMEGAVYIDDIETIDESLEGQFVIIAGTPKMSKNAYDQDFNIQFDYPVVYRTAYVLYDTGAGSKHETSWEKSYRSDENIYGSVDLCGEAQLGAYTISDDVLKFIFENSTDVIVTEELAEQIGWTYYKNDKYTGEWLLSKPLTYKNDWGNWLDRGMLRLTYSAKSKEGKPCTIFGYLDENGRIISTDEYKVKYELGVCSKEEFINKY